MGIQGLLIFLKEQGLLQQFKEWPAGSRIAIDVPIFAHKFIYTERTIDNLISRFCLFATELKQKNCDPIFVFDGERLDLKDQERERRSKARARTQVLQKIKRSEAIEALENNSIEIVSFLDTSDGPLQVDYSDVFTGIMIPTKKDYLCLKETLDSLGYTTRVAKFEAEALCAHLVHTSEAWASLTEDTDSIAFGSPRTIFKFFSEDPILADLDHILKGLSFTRAQFIDLCCMLGTDFCENVYKIGPKNAFKLMQKHGSWKTIYDKEKLGFAQKTRDSADVFDQGYEKAHDCFTSFCNELE